MTRHLQFDRAGSALPAHLVATPSSPPLDPSTPPRPILLSPTSPASAVLSRKLKSRAGPDDPLSTPVKRTFASQGGERDVRAEEATPLPELPRFAEQLSTPLRRRNTTRPATGEGQGTGHYDESSGDLYRGPPPTSPIIQRRNFKYDTQGRELDEDALSLRSMSSRGTASTDASIVSRSRRAVVGAFEAVGRGLGVLGSETSSSSGSSSSSSSDEEGGARKRSGRRSRRQHHRGPRSRTWSMGGRRSSFGSSTKASSDSDSSSDDEPLGRRRVAGRREFVLLLPPQDAPEPTFLSPSTPPERLLQTPSLPRIIEAIRSIRSPPGPTAPSSVPLKPLTPRLILNASPAVPSRSPSIAYDTNLPAQPRSTRPDLPARRTFKPPSIPLPSLALHAPFPSTLAATPAPSPPQSGTTTPTTGWHPRSIPLPKVVLEASTPAGSPGVEAGPFVFGAKQLREAPKMWWLDVHCPSWEDMRALGELLSLHPLTLEDILQQDPREKFEAFDRLGYYFICFRAIDESYFRYTEPTLTPRPTASSLHGLGPSARQGVSRRARKGRVEIVEDRPGKEGLEGVGVGAVNVYLVVLKDGIVSFHFDDVAKHTKLVRDRVLNLEMTQTLSADWIAHGLMDAMVDAFFPLIDFVEEEADEIDSAIILHDALDGFSLLTPEEQEEADRQALNPLDGRTAARMELDAAAEKIAGMTSYEMQVMTKGSRLPDIKIEPGFPSSSSAELDLPTKRYGMARARRSAIVQSPVQAIRTTLRRFRQLFSFLSLSPHHPFSAWSSWRAATRARADLQTRSGPYLGKHTFDRSEMLKRMTDTRRLVTGLSRLLGTKGEVVGRMRKRAEERSGGMGVVGWEIAAHIGDIQDHILSMQGALLHCERILAQSTPTYTSQLHVTLTAANRKMDSLILLLSVISIGVLPCMVIIGAFSQNIRVPKNGDREHEIPGYPHNVFGLVIVAVALAATGVSLLVRQWKRDAKHRWSPAREVI